MRSIQRALAGHFALCIGACAPPSLSETGSILCSGEHTCPGGFECRWDHCCPATSAATTCPPAGTQYTRDPTGHVYVPINAACPEGMENRFGYCCPSDSGSECPTRIIGASCSDDSDCDAPAGLTPLCLTSQYALQLHQSFRTGYCTAQSCDPNVPGICGPNAFCSSSDGQTGTCFRSCTLASGAIVGECRGSAGSQLCLTRNEPDATAGACFPDCSQPENDMQCDTTAGYDCFLVYTGIHACALRCNNTAAMLCPSGYMCSVTTGPGYCRRP